MKWIPFLILGLMAGCVGSEKQPAPPTGVTVITNAPVPLVLSLAATPNKSALVSWAAVNWGRSVSYLVGYGQSSSSFATVVKTTATSYSVNGLKNNNTYYFSVKTVDSQGFQSPWASPVSLTVRPNAQAALAPIP